MSVHGAPRYLRSDNGPEFVARAIPRWLQSAQIETAFIDPGKPWQNGTDESFNGRFRDQHLSLQRFRNRADAKVSTSPTEFKAKHLAGLVDGGARADMKKTELLTGPISAVLQ